MNTIKSIGAVVAGMLVNVILSVGTDTILETTGIFPPIGEGLFVTWMLALALSYRLVFTVLGGYVTAWVAPDQPMKHVRILGIIGTVLGTAGIYVGWDMSQHWYPIALAISAFPVTWLGGVLRTRKTISAIQ